MLEYRIQYKMMKTTMLVCFVKSKIHKVFDVVVWTYVIQFLKAKYLLSCDDKYSGIGL